MGYCGVLTVLHISVAEGRGDRAQLISTDKYCLNFV